MIEPIDLSDRQDGRSDLPGSDEADDVIQEANALVWQKRGEFVVGTNFKAWMFSIAKFKVMSVWRDRKRQKEWGVPEDVLVKLVEEAADSAVEEQSPRREVLGECLDQLRPEDRGLVLRRYFDGGRIKEIASDLGRSADSVKVSLHRIRLVLRACVRRKLNQEEAMG